MQFSVWWKNVRIGRGQGLVLAASLTILTAMAPAAQAQGRCADLALILAIDASGSIDPEEFRVQQLGYAMALNTPRVQSALASAGAVDVGVVIWGDSDLAAQVVPLQRLTTAEDARRLAARIAGLPRTVSGDTGIGSGLMTAIDMPQTGAGCAWRRVINVSGDGLESMSPRARHHVPLSFARNRAADLGIVVNALAIENEVADLSQCYHDRVITGPGAFVMHVAGFDTFGSAIIEKLAREIAPPNLASLAVPAGPGG